MQCASVSFQSLAEDDNISFTIPANMYAANEHIYSRMRSINTLMFTGKEGPTYRSAYKGNEFETFNRGGLFKRGRHLLILNSTDLTHLKSFSENTNLKHLGDGK